MGNLKKEAMEETPGGIGKQEQLADTTSRISRLRDRVLNAPMEVSIIRAKKFTEAKQKYDNKPLIIQRALAFKDTLEATPPVILESELIVGRATEKLRGAVVYPEVTAEWLVREIEAAAKRPAHPFRLSKEEAVGLKEIANQWLGITAYDQMIFGLSPASHELREKIVVAASNFSFGLHLFYPDIKKVLNVGLGGLLRDIRNRKQEALSKNEAQEKVDFYQAVEIVIEAAQRWIESYAVEAKKQASGASGRRSDELHEIARVLQKIVSQPPSTFQEGLQLVYMVHLLLDMADGGHEIPYGRVDQLLYPLYVADTSSGRIDTPWVRELIGAFYVQSSTITHFLESAVALSVDGNTGRLDITLGGIDEKGRDVTNDLSRLFLSVAEKLKTIQPNVMIRLHRNTPDDFFRSVVRILSNGSNVIAVFNDEVIIEALTRSGVELADAREYMVGGCVSPIPRGTYGPLCGSHVFMTKVLERVLHSGKCYETYEDFYQAFKDELSYAITILGETVYAGDIAHEKLLPQPFVSAFVDGAIEAGKDVKSRGGRNNFTGMNFVGFANIVDSLSAIKKLVYGTGELTLDNLVRAIGANFNGYENIRQILINRAPKFGNDEDEVDEIARDLWDYIASEVPQHKTFRGGRFIPGLISATIYMLAGAVSAATPDGRFARHPAAVGGAPVNGASQRGPTAAMNSITAIDQKKAGAGIAINMRFHPSIFRTPEQLKRFEDLTKTYFFELGGQHLQATVVDAETLKKAKVEPDKYTDLMVRVAGYSARFIDLSPMSQDEIISRTEYSRF